MCAVKKDMKKIFFVCLVIFAFTPTYSLGHGGGLDLLGCHHDRRRDDYHCHQGQLAGQSFGSREEALAALGGSSPSTRPSNEPTHPPGVTPSDSQAVPYSRDLYGGWRDADGDCQDTRQEVLIAESVTPVQLNSTGCRVDSGEWHDPFTGQTFTNPRDLDIDHFVPLAEVHRSGGSSWNPQRRRDYANDLSYPGTLIAVSASANRSKGDRDPADWLPPNEVFHCGNVTAWVLAKGYWGLAMDERERQAVYSVLGECESPSRGLPH